MDGYGMYPASKAIMKIYFTFSRRTGRTTRMVAGLRDGDKIVFTNTNEAKRVYRLCREAGLKVQIIVCSPDSAHELEHKMGGMARRGRLIFDHSWVEEWYLRKLDESREWLVTATKYFSERDKEEMPKFYERNKLPHDWEHY